MSITKSLLFLLVLLMTAGLPAQEREVEDVQDISLDDLLNVTVTVATQSAEKVSDAPSSVTVFTRADIRNMGISHLDQLLNFVPGFQVTRDVEQGTADRFSIRGRSTALSESILFLIDGLRINDLYTGGVSILNRLMAVENIKQVEIIRGPGSALYGSNAFLGVVNIITLDDANSAVIRAGNLKFREIAVNWSASPAEKLRLSAFVKAFADEGHPYEAVTDAFGRTGETTDPARGMDAYLTLKYKNLTLHGRYMERTMQDFLTFGVLSNHTNREHSKQTSISAEYEATLNKKLQVDFRVDYMEDRWDTQALLIPKDIEIAPGFALSENFAGGPFLESYHVRLKADVKYRLSTNNQLSLGVSYMNTGISEVLNLMTHHPVFLEYYGDITEFSDEFTFNNKDKTRNIWGIYLQDHFQLGQSITVTLGMRLDRYNDFGSTLNPRAALIYSTPFKGTLKLMYGKAFRAPNYLELYDKNNPVDFGNPDLKPEKVETIELAYIQTFKIFQVGVTYFHSRIRDLIVLGETVSHPDNPLEAPGFSNEGELTSKGLEFEFRFKPAKGLIFSGAYTHLIDADELPVSPGFASFILNYHWKKFNVNVNGIFRRKIALMPTQVDYVLVNTALRYAIAKDFEVQVTARNIFGQNFRTVSWVFPEGVPNRGRTFTLGLTYKR